MLVPHLSCPSRDPVARDGWVRDKLFIMSDSEQTNRWYFILPFLTALLLYTSYHPANIGPLAWIALIPLLIYILKEERFGRLIISLWLSGTAFFFSGLFWVHFVTWPGLVILAIILGGYFVLFGVVVKIIQRKLGITFYFLSIPAWWVFVEYLREWLFTGFPWFYLGHTQYQFLTIIQVVDLTGVYGLSFLIAGVNSLGAFLLCRIIAKEWRWRKAIIPLVGLILAVVVTLTYGYFRLKHIETTPGPLIGLVQGNIEQDIKLSHNRDEIAGIHLRLSGELKRSQNPELIVWAETMCPYPVKHGLMPSEGLKEVAEACQSDMLIGVISYEKLSEGKYNLYNSAYLINDSGAVLGFYDKIHLVPVSEALPLRDIFPWLENLVLACSGLKELPYLQSGKTIEPVKWKDYQVGVLICYESIFPELSRMTVSNGADFIINVSNDGWFKDGAELEQILAISVFRAVENRRSFVRATNTGISAFISPRGELTVLKDPAGRLKEVSGTLARRVALAHQNTLYTRWGDYFPFLVLVIFILVALLKFLRINLTK